MPPSKVNAKKESGRAKKAENEGKKKEAAVAAKESAEIDKWADGAKSNKAKEEKEEKRKAELARKAEKARLLAEEEAAMVSKPKPVQKAGQQKKKKELEAKPAGPGAIAAGGGLEDLAKGEAKLAPNAAAAGAEAETFAATGIDDALELLQIVTAKKDKASVGQQAAGIEKHPERRYKAAFEAYTDRELPNLKVDHPGLRLNQYKELLHKQFQKSPDNPFNQTLVSYDATKEEKVEALERKTRQVEERLRDRAAE